MDILAALRTALDADVIVAPPDIEPRYLGDWICRDGGIRPAALALPRTTSDVSAILRVCHAAGCPIVPQGGRTGLAGGATPADGWVILSLERMRAVIGVDRVAATLTVEAGVTLQAAQDAADHVGLLFALDIGGRGSCTIGGNVATNAGGNRVLRYGMMRDMVLGLEVVLANGTVVGAMNTMLKNNSGYDLKQLFIGSEGTLGVITRAVLRLHPRPTGTQTALCAVRDYDQLMALLSTAKDRLGATLAAFEVMWPEFYRLGTDASNRRAPLPHGQGAYVLVEVMGSDDSGEVAQFQSFVETALESDALLDAVIAASMRESREFWAIRDSSGELQRTFWPYVGFDVSLPIAGIGAFIVDVTARLTRRWPDAQSVFFGHVADSNIHICVRVPSASQQPQAEVDSIVYDAVGAYRGAISAEHGIGLLKRDFLDRSRNAAEMTLMQDLKRALDPAGILNPGKIFLPREAMPHAATADAR